MHHSYILKSTGDWKSTYAPLSRCIALKKLHAAPHKAPVPVCGRGSYSAHYNRGHPTSPYTEGIRPAPCIMDTSFPSSTAATLYSPFHCSDINQRAKAVAIPEALLPKGRCLLLIPAL